MLHGLNVFRFRGRPHSLESTGRLVFLFLLSFPFFFFMPSPSADAAMTDHDIVTAVDTQLMKDNAVQAHRIDVVVKDGIVMLAGTVSYLMASERAARLAMTVKV